MKQLNKPVELQLWQGRGGVGRERGVGGGGGGGGEGGGIVMYKYLQIH